MSTPVEHDPVSRPSHYNAYPGIEVIDLTQHLNFCLGNVVKYVARADHKGKPLEDLRKAAEYLRIEIARREQELQDMRAAARAELGLTPKEGGAFRQYGDYDEYEHYQHDDSQWCVMILGHWYRKHEGTAADAECHRAHTA